MFSVKVKRLVLATALVTTLGASQAQAAFIGATPAFNDVIGVREGWFDANLYLIAGGPVNATIEFLGFEAGNTNSFNINGGAIEYTVGGGSSNFFPAGTNLLNIVLNPGLLDFTFCTSGGGGLCVANGANQHPTLTTLPNFFLSFGFAGDAVVDGSTPGGGTVVLMAFDDAGAGPDDNHDDLVVRLTLQDGTIQVPEPASMILLGLGLVGAGLRLRRRA